MRRQLVAGTSVLVLLLVGCDATKGTPEDGTAGTATPLNLSPDQERLTAKRVESAAALVPEPVRRAGLLSIGGTIDNSPPLSLYATDNKTPIGFELDIALLVADVLGLSADRQITSWDNMFLGIDSGKYDVAFSNISVTDERMKTYDFATYRRDLLGFETREDSGIDVRGPADLAGHRVALASGTTQEQIMLRWSAANEAAGLEPIEIQYYQKVSDYYLALESGRVDVFVGPSSLVVYHAQTSGQTRLAGVVDSAADTISSMIGAMTKQGNGMAQAVAAAVNELIERGEYAQALARWGLDDQTVPSSVVNPSVSAG